MVKAFISYFSIDKKVGSKVKNILQSFGINVFLAHDDILIFQEWKERLAKELAECHIFIAILSKNFKESDWTSQEMGIAYFRDVVIIPLYLDKTIPYGFIEHLQGKVITENNIPLDYLIKPILDKFPDYCIDKIIDELERAGSFREAENVMNLLTEYFDKFSQEQIDKFVEVCIKNGQI